MNFYKAQDHAKRQTRRLVMLFIAAVICLVVITELLLLAIFGGLSLGQSDVSFADRLTQIDPNTALIVALAVVAIIGSASAVRWMQLKAGGAVVAEGLGGVRISADSTDPTERKVLNVVEEMAIASGIPVPPVYLLEESSINAFAAGGRIDNAVIGVTRGCINALSRDELQGVMAHEFSHIVHGDMGLNIRLMSVLNGILFISIIGNFIMRGAFFSGSSRRNNNGGATLALGLGLIVVGYVGVFFGNLIKASVSRQREFLADASAVQFTRNPAGISGALKKIAGYSEGTEISHPRAQEASHMFFGSALSLSSMMATHPPLDVRIKRIDPSFNPKFVQATSASNFSEPANAFSEQTSGFSSQAQGTNQPPAKAPTAAEDSPFDIVEQTGEQHVDSAKAIITSISQPVLDAAHDLIDAQALAIALIDENQAAAQLSWYGERHSAMAELVSQTDQSHAIALLEIACGTLRALSKEALEQFKQQLVATIKADQKISFKEWCLYQVIREPLFPMKAARQNKSLNTRMADAITIVSAMAYQGDNPQAGFASAIQQLKTAAQPLANEPSIQALDQALARIKEVKVLELPVLLKALSACITEDGKVDTSEYELLRALCAALETPLPPL